jgi:putative DNA primase/helicase
VGQDDPCNVSEAIEEVDEEIVSPTDLEYSDDVFVSVCDVRTKKNGDEIVNPRPGAIATYLLEKCRFLTFDDTDAVCYYDPADGLYHTNGEKRIGDAMEELIGDHLTSRIVNESVDHIRRRTRRKREDCIAPPELVPINDGVFNVLDDSIAPYSPDKPFFNRHDFSYDLELLTQETRAKWLVTSAFAPDDVRSIQELGGACLYRAPLYKTAFMILGEGDNGKSIFLAWLRETIGTSAVSALSLYQLAANRFGTAQLVDRCANIYADLGGGDLKYVGTFMAITGGDEVGAEHKGQPYFMYVPFAVLVFSTNKLPDVKDPPDQFYNRWNLIEMPYRFVDDPTEPFERQRDASFELEPINAEDRDWLGTWFIEGLKRLLKTGHFSESESAKNVKERWISKTDSLRAFVNTMVEASEGSSVTKNDFLEAYQAWCGQEGMSAYSERYIGLHLPRYVRTRTTQTRPRGWANISVKGLEARGMPEIEDEAITLGKFENEDDIGD